MDPKVNQILQEIDLARCRAQWSNCLELSKKLKKLRPEDSVLDITITTEVEFIQLLKPEKKYWDIIHEHDTIDKIVNMPILSPQKVAHLIHRLDFINKDDLTSTDHWQIQFSKILLARIYFESGQYQLALNNLENLAVRIEDVQHGYGFVLLVQARAIKGICFEMTHDVEAAIEAYDAAWNAVELQPQEKSIMLSFWIEQCLYRSCLLKSRLNHPVKNTLDMMRAYVQLASSHWSPHWRMFKRWVIFKLYANYLVQTYKENTYIPSNTKSPNEIAVYEELSILMNLFRHLFTAISPCLKPVSQGEYGLSLAHIMMTSHDVLGWGETNHIRRVLQFLYQVKNVTFNNPTVNRFMFFTLLRLGSLEEAKYALRAYLGLMNVPDFDTGFTLDDMHETINPEEKDSVTDQSKPLTTISKANCIIRRLSDCLGESIDSIINVLLAGIKLYGDEEQNGKLAAYLSDLALDLLLQTKVTTKLDQVYRARGCSYGLIASECEDHDIRAIHHGQAINSLQEAVAINNTCWKNHYELGLQQALVRDTHAAIISVSKSIELYPHNVDSWHLLALLYSCKRTDDLPKALKTLEAGLQQSIKNVSSANGIPVFSWTRDEINASDLYRQAESYLSIRMSLLTLKEVMQGPESIMDQYQELFTTYTQLTQQLGISFNVEESVIITNEKRKTSLIRRTSFTLITNSISSTSRRRRSSSVESRAQSDSDDSSRHGRKPPATIHRSNSTLNNDEMKKRSLQLIDLGLAKRIGTAAANPPQYGKRQDSNRSLVTIDSSAVSLASMLKPSYSIGSLRSNSVSSRSSSVANTTSSKAATKDGLIISTFQQHHQAFENRQKTRWQSLLVTLWLMSTKTFIKAGLLDEANKALGEAEELGLGDPGVWYELGQLNLKARDFIQNDTKAIEEINRVARDAFEKALVLDSKHVPSQVAKAKLFFESQQVDLADGLLEQITHGFGWDSAEAWYEYGKLLQTKQTHRSKTCFLFALELNDTEPLRNLTIFKRFIS